jgi:predicted RNA-binding Zn ribbon-like protein
MDVAMLEANLPVLGEPVPIELANTRYHDDGETIEFLASPALVSAWFDASPTANGIARPTRWTDDGWHRLIELRDTIEELLRALIDGRSPDRAAVERLNAVAALTTRRVELSWDPNGDLQRIDRSDATDRTDAALATLAVDAIELIAGPDASLIRVCANDDCEMMFVKHHHRRRWCHNSCGHRHRQATYYRSQRQTQAGGLD